MTGVILKLRACAAALLVCQLGVLTARLDGLVDAFNLTNRVNNVTRNGSFGSGTYPTSPSSTFCQVTAVGDPRSIQFGLRVRF